MTDRRGFLTRLSGSIALLAVAPWSKLAAVGKPNPPAPAPTPDRDFAASIARRLRGYCEPHDIDVKVTTLADDGALLLRYTDRRNPARVAKAMVPTTGAAVLRFTTFVGEDTDPRAVRALGIIRAAKYQTVVCCQEIHRARVSDRITEYDRMPWVD